MHYTANHQKHAKVSTIKTLVRRAKTVCSSQMVNRNIIITTIRRALLSNSKSKNRKKLRNTKTFYVV